MSDQPSEMNLAILVKTGITNAALYPKQMTNRKGLTDYLLSIGNIPADDLAVSNFHVMTANLGGYFSPINKAAFCTEAIQYAIQGGARCIIFDVWPNTNKKAKLGPILKVCANDESLEKLSYYTMNLTQALQTVRKEAFENSANPGNQDPMFLFFRFRGITKDNTNKMTNLLNETANAISATLEEYRLPFSYTRTTSDNKLPSTPMNILYKKVIILSDQTGILDGVKTRFADYVNNPIVPSTPFTRKQIATPGELHGLSQSNRKSIDTTSKTSFISCAPLPEDTANSESNAWDWKDAHKMGIQFCGLNFWVMDAGLKAYTDPSVFGTYSFMIKDDKEPEITEGFATRYRIERIPPPIPVKSLGYKDGTVTIK